MRVLWTINARLPALLQDLGETTPLGSGTWLEPLFEELRRRHDLELEVVSMSLEHPSLTREIDGVKHHIVHARRRDFLVGSPKRSLGHFQRIVSEFRPDVIHVWGTESSFNRAILQSVKDVPILLSPQAVMERCGAVHSAGLSFGELLRCRTLRDWMKCSGMLEQKIRAKLIGRGEYRLIDNASFVLCDSRWTRAQIRERMPRMRTDLVEHIMREPFRDKQWSLGKHNPHTITVPAPTHTLKGLHVLLHAAAMLKSAYPNLKIRIPSAGIRVPHAPWKGWVHDRGYPYYLSRLVRDLALEEHVEPLERLSPEDMAEEMRRAHVFCVTSSIESYSVSLCEAMTVGTPCVASYVGGMTGKAWDGREALFYPFGDVAMLADRIRTIFEDDALAESLSQNARQRALKRHDRGETVSRTMKAYASTVSDS